VRRSLGPRAGSAERPVGRSDLRPQADL